MSQTTTIFKKLANLEQEVQKLKVQAYLNLPKKEQTFSLYPQNNINKALTATRNQIWQEKYAKKLKTLHFMRPSVVQAVSFPILEPGDFLNKFLKEKE